MSRPSPPTTSGPSAHTRQGAPEPDADRALGRHGVDGRAEPEQGSVPELPVGVAAVAPDDVWAVGTWFTKAFDDRTLTLHWDGTAWHRVKSPNAGPAAGGERSRVGVRRSPPTTSGRSGVRRSPHAHDALGRHVVVGRREPDARRERGPGGRRGRRRRRRLGGGRQRRSPGERRSERSSSIGTAWLDGRGEREQGPERQPPVGDLGRDRPDARGRRRFRAAAPVRWCRSPWSAAAPESPTPCVSAGGPTIAPCPRSVSPPTSSPPETSRRPSRSSSRASRPASRTSRSWARPAPARRSRSRTWSRPSSARPW